MKNIKSILVLLASALCFTASAFTSSDAPTDEKITVISDYETPAVLNTIINQKTKTPMANISINVNLTQLKHVVREFNGESGKVKCLVIPIKENDLFEGEKNIFLSLNAFELKEPRTDSKTTHLVKQQLQKETFALLNDEDKRNMPIIGDAVYWGKREPNPVASNAISADSEPDDGNDDLPF